MDSNKKNSLNKITLVPYKKEAKELFPETLEKFRGRIMDTCRYLNISAETYYQWKRSDPIFKKACKEAEYRVVDYAESKLWEHIEKGCSKCLLHFLKVRGRRRGWDSSRDPDYYNEEEDFWVKENI